MVEDPNSNNQKFTVWNIGSEEISDITKQKIRMAVGQMKKRKSLGEDRITCEMLKLGGNFMEKILQVLFKCLFEGNIPEIAHNTEIILLFKKGDITDIENYFLLSLLTHLY